MNQMLFRDVNERVKDLNEGFSFLIPAGEWICECANDACSERIEMSGTEYEQIRSDGACFFCRAEHEHVWLGVERVTERNDCDWIVEKLGEAGEMARGGDPRSEEDALPLS